MIEQSEKVLKSIAATTLCRKVFDHHATLQKTVVDLRTKQIDQLSIVFSREEDQLEDCLVQESFESSSHNVMTIFKAFESLYIALTIY